MGRSTTRLRRLAGTLEPERAPWYVRRAELPFTLRPTFPVDGWYWIPREHHVAVFLAATELDATVLLTRMINERNEAEDAA